MKKSFSLTLSLIVLLNTSLVGCKKGSNDPLLSFRSRKKRLIGEYILDSYEKTEKNSNEIYHESYSQGVKTYQYENGQYGSYPYHEKLNFEKNGTFYHEIIISGTISEIVKGSWSFLSKNKSEGTKNKEAIQLYVNYHEIYNPDGTSKIIEKENFGTSEIFLIDELRNDKIVLTSELIVDGDKTMCRYEYKKQ